MSSALRPERFHPHRAQLAEGLLWHPVTHRLYWIDIVGHEVFEADLAGTALRRHDVGRMIGAVVPTRDGHLLAVLHDGIYKLDTATGELTPRARPEDLAPARVRFNDAKCDPRGRLWAGTMALKGERDLGQLYRFDADERLHVMLAPVSLSNGLAWSPDERIFYYIDTPTKQVRAFPFDPATGNLGAGRVAIDLTDHPGAPDGCTIDQEGHLWIAHWGGACVTRWDAAPGRKLATIPVPARQVTTCTFGGPALDQLFISTAALGLSPEQRAAEPDAGCIFRVDAGTRGLPAVAWAGH